MIRAIHGPDPEEELRNDTRKYGHWWRHEAYVEKLTTAIGIYERALGRRPMVFRTGALSQTPELYDAMAEVGMRYASNSVIDPRGWEYIVGNYEKTETGKVVSREARLVADLIGFCQRKFPGNGVALYWYGSLDDAQIDALRAGPFREAARPAWLRAAHRSDENQTQP